MSDFLDEEVPPVNPLSMTIIEEIARCFLSQFSPDALIKPQPLDIVDLVENKLPDYGIHVTPASREELGDRAGVTDPSGNEEINILVSEEIWDSLFESVPTNYFSKTTICHELGHAILHVPVLRRRLLHEKVLSFVKRRNIRAYEDPEWQAWAFAGSILMPSVTLRMLQSASDSETFIETVHETYEISYQMTRSHLKRLKW